MGNESPTARVLCRLSQTFGPSTHHSCLMPASLITLAHRWSSSAIFLRNCSGVVGAGSSAPAARRWRMSGDAIARVSSSCSFFSTGFGVPPTDTTLYQLVTCTPEAPPSSKVGISGISELLLTAAGARAYSRPDLVDGRAGGGEVIVDWIWPPATSVADAPVLL